MSTTNANVMKPEAVDPVTSPDEVLRAYWELDVAIHGEQNPGDPHPSFEHALASWRTVPAWARQHRWLLRDADGKAVASAYLGLAYLDSNRHLANFDIKVVPGARRQGFGRGLARVVAETARDDERTMLSANSLDHEGPSAFLEHLGAECRASDRRSDLVVADLDPELLESWVARGPERAAGYELVGIDDRCPDDLVEEVNAVQHVMNTAPRDDLEMEDFIQTTEQFRERESIALEAGHHWWTLLARRKGDSELAGFTEIGFLPWYPTAAFQEGTGVRPEHRNLGLARWLKAAMLLRLRAERPDIERVITWNAFSNGPMLGINIALGFELTRSYRQWQVPVDVLLARVGAGAQPA